MEVSIRGEMTVQFEVVNPATLELKKSKVNYTYTLLEKFRCMWLITPRQRALFDEKFRHIEGNGRKFSYIGSYMSVIRDHIV